MTRLLKEVRMLSSPNQPKERFYTRIGENDFLGLTVWRGKADPTAEVLVVQLRRREGDNWETMGRLAVYRSSKGDYSKLPERRSNDQTGNRQDFLKI